MKIVGVDIVGVVEETGQVIVSITLEDSDGYRDSFMIDAWELLDTQEVAKILYRWKTTILPLRKTVHKKVRIENNIADILDFVKSMEGIEVADTDDETTIRNKIEKVGKSKKRKILGGNQ